VAGHADAKGSNLATASGTQGHFLKKQTASPPFASVVMLAHGGRRNGFCQYFTDQAYQYFGSSPYDV
jgi:hypothetical protein